MENIGIFYDRSEYFTAILYNSWLFGTFWDHLVYFSGLSIFGPKNLAITRSHLLHRGITT
jgi:hypothetical protein